MRIINNNKANNKAKKKIKPEYRNRHKARELAVQFLYSLDNNLKINNDFEKSFELFFDLVAYEEITITDEAMISEIKDYCKYLAQGTWNAKYKIDEILLRAVTGWRPDSMNAVDLAILRLAVFESFLDKKLEFKAAISEATSIAQVFGAEKSPRFIHGVLAKIYEYLNLTNERSELKSE